MAVETVTKEKSSSLQEFESLLNDDFKDRKLKENEVIKAVVTEITKNFIVVDCKAKMEGMIPIEEFKDDNELEKLKVGSKIEVYLERIESFKGEIVISREKARRLNAWKKLEKVFETGEEMIRKNIKVKNEFYVSEIYNMLLESGGKFEIDMADEFIPLGTPNDIKKFEV